MHGPGPVCVARTCQTKTIRSVGRPLAARNSNVAAQLTRYTEGTIRRFEAIAVVIALVRSLSILFRMRHHGTDVLCGEIVFASPIKFPQRRFT